jgi:mRNA deadenylase 3'-5' endonuclease subunit Ccr4
MLAELNRNICSLLIVSVLLSLIFPVELVAGFSSVQSSSRYTTMIRTKPAFAVRVVSYNVLSSHLADPSYYTTLNPDHLEASNRLPKVLKLIDEQIDTSKNCIICLQEVSYDWAGSFHTYFANKGYHMVTGLYGRRFNGYMGVALAYPIETYETMTMDISNLSDKRIGGWPKAPTVTLLSKILSNASSLWSIPLKFMGRLSQQPKEDHWSMSERRSNVLLTAILKDKATGRSICIGNYHMPCAFFMPMTMTIHAEMAAKHVQDIATANQCPYILAGDWNIKPASETYNMMTTGQLATEDPTFPTPKYGMEWQCTMEAMRSAYAEYNGNEPDYTNYSRVKEQAAFIDTLDYIFLSKEWKVTGVKPIGNREDAGGPFPNADEPSDHVLIRADLHLDEE